MPFNLTDLKYGICFISYQSFVQFGAGVSERTKLKNGYFCVLIFKSYFLAT